MGYADPSTPADWYATGTERKIDAGALEKADRRVAALYFYGFAAECYAKALLAGTSRGRQDAWGHDLIQLCERAGFGRAKIPVDLRAAAENRDVALRYQSEWPLDLEDEETMRMQKLMTWLEVRSRRVVEKRVRLARRPRSAAATGSVNP